MVRLFIFVVGLFLFSISVFGHSNTEDIPDAYTTLEQRDAYVQTQDYSKDVWIPLVFFAGLGIFAFFMGAVLGGVD